MPTKRGKGTKRTKKLTLEFADNEGLTSPEAQHIVVDNTPLPHNFNGPDQLLHELGIFSDKQVPGHKAGIIRDLRKKKLTIDEAAITSGPGISVAICRDSVLRNAH